jgi:hypothetical protein
MAASFLTRVYEKLPFALRRAEAQKQIEERRMKIVGELKRPEGEPITARRRIR